MERFGTLPSQEIEKLMNLGSIVGASRDNVNPASLDLAITGEVYRTNGVFQPRVGENISDLLKSVGARHHDVGNPLEKDVVYLAKLSEGLKLPSWVYGYGNPKSSTGRDFVHVRNLADGTPRYDAASSGYSGDLWLSIVPKANPILLREGETLNQIRFFNKDTRFSELELEVSMKEDNLVWDVTEDRPLSYGEIKIRDNDGSMILTLDVPNGLVGYRAKATNEVLDFSKNYHDRRFDFFEPIESSNGAVHLEKGRLYILTTKEGVRIPPHLSCEMASMDERCGDFRSHYAGYIDPGFGYGVSGEGNGSQLTLELRPFEDIVVRDAQPIAKIKFERMLEIPNQLYEAKSTSHYSGQRGPQLSKRFQVA